MSIFSASSAAQTFLRGGVHMEDHKELTARKPIERMITAEVVIPLHQHMGAPARAIVKRKDVVTLGDVIGEAAPDGVPVHASVSGKVLRVALQPHPIFAEAEAVVIETDPSIPEPIWEEIAEWRSLSVEAMLKHIEAAGIVGLGGAAFPTHRKLRLPEGIQIDTLVINGAECEPYLTSDHRVMLERAEEVLLGATLIAKIIGAQRVVIGVEDNKTDAIATLESAVAQTDFNPNPVIGVCKTRYPQGSEKQLIEALIGRVVPPRKLPMNVGVVVQNVATAIACYEAIRYRKPLTDRVITVSGGGINEPRNLLVPIGTMIEDVVTACGGMHSRTCKVIAGGPMMGRALGRLDVPIVKGTSGLLFLRVDEVRAEMYGPCISCGKCLEVCPLGLEPNQISVYTEAGRAMETENYGTKECFECGCCSYICPAERPLVQFIQIAKSAFHRGSGIGLSVRPGDKS